MATKSTTTKKSKTKYDFAINPAAQLPARWESLCNIHPQIKATYECTRRDYDPERTRVSHFAEILATQLRSLPFTTEQDISDVITCFYRRLKLDLPTLYGSTEAFIAECIKKADRWIRAEELSGHRNPVVEPPNNHLPLIIVSNNPLRDISDNAMEALQEQQEEMALYQRKGTLVQIEACQRDGQHVIALVDEDRMRGKLTRAANFMNIGKFVSTHVDPPKNVISDLLVRGDWPFPELHGITSSPILRPDGSLVVDDGYDKQAKLYYDPDWLLELPEMPETPTQADALQAYQFLCDEWLHDFCFETDADRDNAIAFALTQVTRPIFSGPSPLLAVTSKEKGSGKGLLVATATRIATGRPLAFAVTPTSPAEWAKTILAELKVGTPVIVFDEVTQPLGSGPLQQALTTDVYSGRVLGSSEILRLPQRSAWAACGNNLSVQGDMARRVYWVRLDAKQRRPWERSGFKYNDLAGFVEVERGQFLAALLTMARAWIMAGSPEPVDLPIMGSYDDWRRTVGGILYCAGGKAFLANQREMYDRGDWGVPQALDSLPVSGR